MLNQNDKYNKNNCGQAGKWYSIKKSKVLVRQVKEMFEPYLKSCEEYEPEEDLRINQAPAVKVNGKLVIAPDLKCTTFDDKIFWVEVKDKAQRFYFSDTGADLHQVLGWYDINYYLQQPVLIIFKDPDLEKCMPKNVKNDNLIKNFKKRWESFDGDLYGGWLNNLIKIDSTKKYPCIYKERSREQEMYILYFDINKMKKIKTNIGAFIKDRTVEIDKPISCYIRLRDENGKLKDKELINETKIRKLSY